MKEMLRLFNLTTYLFWNRNLQICFATTILAAKHVTVHYRFFFSLKEIIYMFIFKAPSTRIKLYQNKRPILPEPTPVSVAFK